jgi:hypothetical protein
MDNTKHSSKGLMSESKPGQIGWKDAHGVSTADSEGNTFFSPSHPPKKRKGERYYSVMLL